METTLKDPSTCKHENMVTIQQGAFYFSAYSPFGVEDNITTTSFCPDCGLEISDADEDDDDWMNPDLIPFRKGM